MKIPFLNLKELNAPYKEKFKQQFDLFLDSGYYILGESVKKFEKEFANYCGTKYCIGTGNGLDALTLIFKAYIELGKLKKGDAVLLAANTYIATVLAVENAGLKPVLIDVNKETFNLEPSLLPQKPAIDIKAIMVTHLYGQLADMVVLRRYCSKYNLLLLSDAAQAHGACDNNGIKAGNLADASGFSFYPTKNLGALGDGGAVTTNDSELATCIYKLRNYGSNTKYNFEYKGVNSRLDELQAYFLSIKLTDLEVTNNLRKEIAKRYLLEINNYKITLPKVDNFDSHVFHQFVIKVKDRDVFTKFLDLNTIGYLIHYPIPPYKQKCFKNKLSNDFPVTDMLSETVISLPIGPYLKTKEVDYIIEKLNNY